MTPQPPKPVELKPCPFCGSFDIDPEGVASFKEQYQTSDNTWDKCTPGMIENRPACNNCGATTNGEWNARSEPTNYDNQAALNYAQHARELLNDGEIENADGLLGTCIETLSAALTAAAIPQAEGKDDGYEYFWLIESGPTDAPDYLFHERWRWHWTKDINKAWKTHDREIATIMFIEHARKSSRVTQHGFLKKPATTERDE